MNKLILLALAGASASFTAAPVFSQNTESASSLGSGTSAQYNTLMDKAASDYRTARAACDSSQGNAKKVCREEAQASRARNEADAVAQYRNTPEQLSKARSDVAKAEYDVAKAKCDGSTVTDRSACLREARSVQNIALADAREGRQNNMAAGASGQGAQGSGSGNNECDQLAATDKTACLSRNAGSKTRDGMAETGTKAKDAMADTGSKAKDAMANTGSKAKDMVAGTAATTKRVASDTALTTKVKAAMVRDPDLKAMDVHVDTVDGVVMLSGFVSSDAEVSKAEALARGIDGVKDVKSALKPGKPETK
jgi:hyperosmotically inducible protein